MIFNTLKSIIFNEKCILCDNINDSKIINLLCEKCYNSFVPNKNFIKSCKICGHPLNDLNSCESCNKLKNIYYDNFSFIQYYSDYYKNILYRLKKLDNYLILNVFADLLINSKLLNYNDYITVVPGNFTTDIKKGRASLNYLLTLLKKRGYKILKNIYKKRLFIIKKQKYKDETHRIKEISKIYYLPESHINKYNGNIILIDDIYTTGATVNFGANLLKIAGFKKVKVITVFRAILNQN